MSIKHKCAWKSIRFHAHLQLKKLSLLVNDIETGVRLESLGDTDAFGSLVILEEGSHDAWQCQSRAVEGVAQMSLLVVATVAAFEAVGLISLKVGN